MSPFRINLYKSTFLFKYKHISKLNNEFSKYLCVISKMTSSLYISPHIKRNQILVIILAKIISLTVESLTVSICIQNHEHYFYR